MTTFTPLSKENMIGVMLARCDGPHLGEIVVLEMSKQELILGPMQVNARINQDQSISKDLTLWNQQGSQVLQGQTLVLPVDDNFVYISPLYLQATQARRALVLNLVSEPGETAGFSAERHLHVLAQHAPGFRVHDIVVDEASQVQTYKQSFKKVLDRDGWDGLIRRMQKAADKKVEG